MNEQRKAFEAWATSAWNYNIKPAREESADTYMEGETETAWMGWQAALASQSPKEAMSDASNDVLAERHRQIEIEGWTEPHDDQYDNGQLIRAAVCYALHKEPVGNLAHYRLFWPWHETWWKPSDKRRNLVKAGALILAEIERLDRAALASVVEAAE